MIAPACSGEGCPLRGNCLHYSMEQIDRKKMDHFPYPPYNHQKGECEFNSDPMKKIRDILNNRKNGTHGKAGI